MKKQVYVGIILLVGIMHVAISQTHVASMDAFIRGGAYADSTFGTDSSLFVSNGTEADGQYKSLLKFDLRAENIDSEDITQAILRCKRRLPIIPETDQILVFGEAGQHKMLYDPRTRPMNVYIDGKVHIAINAGATSATTRKTVPQVLTYDVASKTFSNTVTLGESSSDHHDGPMIWADMNDKLHIFYGWHHDLGKHLVSNNPDDIGTSESDWSKSTAPSLKMSYPWVSRCVEDKHLVFYRTDGHYSSWTYRISGDNGNTWDGPVNDLTDLDLLASYDGNWTDADTLMDWSCYTAKAISKDGNYLHVSFNAYDDYKRPRTAEEDSVFQITGKLNPDRQKNPLYDYRRVSYNYNLYYVKVDLRSDVVTNFSGDTISTPITYQAAMESCMIWDTEWRGGSVIPFMLVDENDQVSFVHNISDFQHEDSLDYHYVKYDNGDWKNYRITDSNHEWNGTYLEKDKNGTMYAYLITGDGYNDLRGDMNNHGGGDIEEWVSVDGGETWEFSAELKPEEAEYSTWQYNNVQPVKEADGTIIENMLLFYGWDPEKEDVRDAKAFLYIRANKKNGAHTNTHSTKSNDDADPAVILANKINDNWEENSVIWSTAPATGGVLSAIYVGFEGEYFEWDLTSYVKAELASDQVVSICLDELSATEQVVEFHSKESAANFPELVINKRNTTSAELSSYNSQGQDVAVYPNPLKDGSLFINLNDSENSDEVDIVVTNLLGSQVYNTRQLAKGIIEIKARDLQQKGFYLVSVRSGDLYSTTKLVVQ